MHFFSLISHIFTVLSSLPEDKVIEMKIDLIRSEIEQDKDTLTFVRTKKINYISKVILNENNQNNNINKIENKNDIISNNNIATKSKIKEDRAPKFKLNFNNLRDSNSSIKENTSSQFNNIGKIAMTKTNYHFIKSPQNQNNQTFKIKKILIN